MGRGPPAAPQPWGWQGAPLASLPPWAPSGANINKRENTKLKPQQNESAPQGEGAESTGALEHRGASWKCLGAGVPHAGDVHP